MFLLFIAILCTLWLNVTFLNEQTTNFHKNLEDRQIMIILDGARAELMRLVPRKVGRSWSVRPGEDCRLDV